MTTDHTAVMRQALEALEQANAPQRWPFAVKQDTSAAINALRDALAAPAEPVASLTDKWRDLALKFDRHRMAAMWHLRALLADPGAHAAAARAFLDEPPPAEPAAPPPSDPCAPREVWDAINNGEFEPGQWTASACRAIEKNPAGALRIIANLRNRLATPAAPAAHHNTQGAEE